MKKTATPFALAALNKASVGAIASARALSSQACHPHAPFGQHITGAVVDVAEVVGEDFTEIRERRLVDVEHQRGLRDLACPLLHVGLRLRNDLGELAVIGAGTGIVLDLLLELAQIERLRHLQAVERRDRVAGRGGAGQRCGRGSAKQHQRKRGGRRGWAITPCGRSTKSPLAPPLVSSLPLNFR